MEPVHKFFLQLQFSLWKSCIQQLALLDSNGILFDLKSIIYFLLAEDQDEYVVPIVYGSNFKHNMESLSTQMPCSNLHFDVLFVPF